MGFFFEGEDSHGDHGLGSLVQLRFKALLVLHIHISPSTSSGQRNCGSWGSQPQKSVTRRPQPGGETAKSIRNLWWHWGRGDILNDIQVVFCFDSNKSYSIFLIYTTGWTPLHLETHDTRKSRNTFIDKQAPVFNGNLSATETYRR
jgi:hypothetical protein